MAQSREVVYLSDFTGGLNLTTSLQSLAPNESSDALNVDFGGRGGFVSRGGFQSQDYNAALNGAIFLGPTYFSNDVFLIVESDGTLHEWDGTTLTDTTFDLTDVAFTGETRIRMAPFTTAGTGKAYLSNCRNAGVIEMKTWNGATVAVLGTAWNNDYTTPAAGNMPLARHIANHNGYMWVADTVESGTRYPHRVRWSHLQNPEDWAEDDYIDVDPDDDGDPITGIATFKEVLVIFKRSSVYAIYGYDRTNYTLERLSSKSGVCTCGAMSASAGVMYWFSTDGNIMGFNGHGVVPVTDKLRWWSDNGKIKHGGAHRLMWADERLFLRLEAGSAESVNFWTFVYDPSTRSLTRYDPVVTELWHWVRIGVDGDSLFLFESDQNLYRFDRAYSVDTVDAGAGPVNTRIDARYRTSWITVGETATKKRWKRPRVTAAADGDTTITIDVYHDFNELDIKSRSEVDITTFGVQVWDTMNWDTNEWSGTDDDFYVFSRQPSAGSGHAVQFEFSSNDNSGRWWVNSIALPFRRRQVR
jgi:hypothetical protein